jgi:hypothetical protein
VWVLLKNHSWFTASSTKVRFVVQVYFVFNAHDFFDPVRQPTEYFTVRDGKIKKHGTKNDQNTPARKQKREEREKKMNKKRSAESTIRANWDQDIGQILHQHTYNQVTNSC